MLRLQKGANWSDSKQGSVSEGKKKGGGAGGGEMAGKKRKPDLGRIPISGENSAAEPATATSRSV